MTEAIVRVADAEALKERAAELYGPGLKATKEWEELVMQLGRVVLRAAQEAANTERTGMMAICPDYHAKQDLCFAYGTTSSPLPEFVKDQHIMRGGIVWHQAEARYGWHT